LVEDPPEDRQRRVQAELDRFGLGLKIESLPRSTRTASEAAEALGCEMDSIVKSMVFRGCRTGKAYLVEIRGSHRVDLNLLAQAIGEKVEMAQPDFVAAQTGFPVGSVAPVGHRAKLETYIDETLLDLREVWAAAGSDHTMVRLTPQQLILITGGKPVRISAE
jgi:Cys-tRNA(Pro) deacylase